VRAWADGFGRVHDDLRLSVTDRCNLRCAYCMPEEPVWFRRAQILTYEEILRLVQLLARRGVRKVRLTGGEPLLRAKLPLLVGWLAAVPEIEDLSLTTNGLLLADQAGELARAGLARLNVSLDTLDAGRFRRLSGRDGLGRVLAGLRAAAGAGLPVKLNTVVLRGHNDDEVEALVEFAREEGHELRFIEQMPLDNGGQWDASTVVTGEELRLRIGRRWPLAPDAAGDPRAPARRYLFHDGGGAVGFIDSVSRPFCADCGRLRLTADGKLRVCLYDDRETDLRAPLRDGASDGDLERLIERAVAGKGRGGALDILEARRAPVLARTMHQIGG